MGWLSRRPTQAACPLDLAAEAKKLQQALDAAALIMNDDIDGAEAGLKEGDSSFHKVGFVLPYPTPFLRLATSHGAQGQWRRFTTPLGKGLVAFVRAILGFEKDVMKEASDLLAAADRSAASDYKKLKEWLDAQDRSSIPQTGIYRPETIYLLCQSMAQLMSAMVGVLNETLKESAIAFYKLNKAYGALEKIMQMEEAFLRKNRRKGAASPRTVDGLSSAASSMSISNTSGTSTPQLITADPDSDIFEGPFDCFTHTGANLCFGALMLFLSMVPPTFATLLSIVGFRGDRDRGLRMLWQASKFENLLGAIAGLALLDFYNAIIRSSVIIPDLSGDSEKDVSTYPNERLNKLLKDMCERFPNSQLWLLEGSRMQAFDKRLDLALETLNTTQVSPLKQVEALHMFELSFNALFSHQYELSAQSFIKCVDINSWSQALYIYNAASCYLCLYRKSADDKAAAEKYAKRATELYNKVPDYAGKKKFLASQLPFDVYVLRKVTKFQDRARRLGVPLVDAIGVDPVEEMIFLWNGQARMSEQQLQDSLENLRWCDESAANRGQWRKENHDTVALLAVVRAGILREQRRHDEAKALLKSAIFDKPEPTKDPYHEDWVRPLACYEMAANAWMQRSEYRALSQVVDARHGTTIADSADASGSADGASHPPANGSVNGSVNGSSGKEGDAQTQTQGKEGIKYDRQRVAECKEYIDRLAKWHTYELHARIGMKVTMAQATIHRWELEHAAA
ncbi:Mitochondrial outer membrane protein iml2 [Ascosphaera acerosa]|nr:Mitochondrial outer membrane protein iml2 [Ascosphaera acerosa]